MRAYLTALVLIFIVGCAPMSEKTRLKHEQYEYDQQERELAFDEYKYECEKQNAYVFIERYGKARRNQVIRNVPGPGDGLKCLNREHKY